MEKQKIVIIGESIKLASLVKIWVLWVVTLWRRILAILRIWEIWSMEDLCILRVVVPCKNRWPLEKIRILHWVDFGQNEYEFCLDMCDAPRVCGMKLETDSCLDQRWSKESEENVKLIRDRLKVAQSWQKSYADIKTQGGSLWNWRQSMSSCVPSARN